MRGALPEPYYDDGTCTIYHADCRDLLPALTFDAVVTDPPYGIGYSGLTESLNASFAGQTITGDDTQDLAEWVTALPYPLVVFGAHEFPHLLRPSGSWFCWDKRLSEAADKMVGTPFELAWASWEAPNRMLRCLHGGVVNANGANVARSHPTEKPFAVMRAIIQHVDAGTICDPFMGSGTTLRAAKDLGRRAIGIEIEERYCEIAANRLAQEVLPL